MIIVPSRTDVTMRRHPAMLLMLFAPLVYYASSGTDAAPTQNRPRAGREDDAQNRPRSGRGANAQNRPRAGRDDGEQNQP